MDLFKGIDYGTLSNFRLFDQDVRRHVPELADVLFGSAMAGAYLWLVFLAILVWRWRSMLGRFPAAHLVKVLLIIAAVEALSQLLGRDRPPDAQEFFKSLAAMAAPYSESFSEAIDISRGGLLRPGFPNGPTFRAVLISALMWETAKPGWGSWLGLFGAVLYCVWVVMGQLMMHLGFLTDILASLALGLGIGFFSPRIFPTSRRASSAGIRASSQ